jgi:hypothetical protein
MAAETIQFMTAEKQVEQPGHVIGINRVGLVLRDREILPVGLIKV